MDKITQIDKVLSGKGIKILSIFFRDWYSLKEASKIYDPNLPKNCRNHRTVAYYFYPFKKLGLLEEKSIMRKVKRKTSRGKDSTYPSKCTRYRTNYESFFSGKNFSSRLKNFILFFLNQNIVRKYLLKNYNENIPSGFEDVTNQLLLLSISFESLEALGKNNRFDYEHKTTIFDVGQVTHRNYKTILNKKIEEIEYKVVKGEKFRVLVNLFSTVMANLFLTEQMEEIEKISPFYKNYLWIFNMWNDIKYANLNFLKDRDIN